MVSKQSNGALLSRGQETSAHCSQRFHSSKLFKMRLVNTHPTIFGDYSLSDQWDLFVNAMDDDLYKRREFKFRHPKHKDKEYERHYLGCPVNGMALLAVGQFKTPKDFAYVWIISKSVNYGEPYLVIEKYAQSFRNPHVLAEMVERAFNWVLKGTSVKFVLEPWETDETIMWHKDFSESYDNEVRKCKDKGPILVGYEDALEGHLKMAARKAKRHIAKEDSIEGYILYKDKKKLMALLRNQIKNVRSSKKIAMPFRLLSDRKLMKRIPYKVVMSAFPELKGRISETRYNHWNNIIVSSYKGNTDYESFNKEIDMLLRY